MRPPAGSSPSLWNWPWRPPGPGGWFDCGTLASGSKLGDSDGDGTEDIRFYNSGMRADGAWKMLQGSISGWLAEPSNDAPDPIAAGKVGSTADQIVWLIGATGAVMTFRDLAHWSSRARRSDPSRADAGERPLVAPARRPPLQRYCAAPAVWTSSLRSQGRGTPEKCSDHDVRAPAHRDSSRAE